jgi:3-oxoacyl-[acyl-carrier-protein] synthase II
MASPHDIVITGVGAVCPIGIGKQAVWQSLVERRSGVQPLYLFNGAALPAPFGGVVAGFDPLRFIRPRKSIKVMSRDIQLAFAAAEMACDDAETRTRPIDPDRLGIVFGADMIACELGELTAAFRGCMTNGHFDFGRWGKTAMDEVCPLWLLKYLPNMPACHVGMSQDARGPTNSLTMGEVSSLAALAEGIRVIERGHADAMIVGGSGSRLHAEAFIRGLHHEMSRRSDDPAAASRPFDAMRDGAVNGEGAAAFVVESRRHAEGRGAKVLARVLGYAEAFEPNRNGTPRKGSGIRNAISRALCDARVEPRQIGHVNAHGESTRLDDEIEARAIRETLGDVPVTAPKSFFGNLGAGTGAVEMTVSLLALQRRLIPPTLNYHKPDPKCPVSVVNSSGSPLERPTALVLNHTPLGHAVAVVLGGAE